MAERTVKRADAKLIAELACDLAGKATDWKERALAAEEALKKFAGEIYASADAAIETADFYAARYAERCGQLGVAQARITALEKALKAISELDIPRERAAHWFPDGRPSKHDKCPHGIWMYEDCGECIARFADDALSGRQDEGEGNT